MPPRFPLILSLSKDARGSCSPNICAYRSAFAGVTIEMNSDGNRNFILALRGAPCFLLASYRGRRRNNLKAMAQGR